MLGSLQSNAVSQFAAWAREETAWRAAAAEADGARVRAAERLRLLRLRQQQLSRDARESSDALGRYHRQRDLLRREKDRLARQLRDERVLLQQCAAESEQLAARETAAKNDFCNEAEALNEELSALLAQQEDRRLQKLFSAESLAALRAHVLVTTTTAAKHDTPPPPHHTHNTNDDGGGGVAKLVAAVDAWVAADVGYQDARKEGETMQNAIGALRARALALISSGELSVRAHWTGKGCRRSSSSRRNDFAFAPPRSVPTKKSRASASHECFAPPFFVTRRFATCQDPHGRVVEGIGIRLVGGFGRGRHGAAAKRRTRSRAAILRTANVVARRFFVVRGRVDLRTNSLVGSCHYVSYKHWKGPGGIL